MVASLDEIVWAVNPENDSLMGLERYLHHVADEFFPGLTGPMPGSMWMMPSLKLQCIPRCAITFTLQFGKP